MLTQGVLETLNRLIEGGELTSTVEQYMTYLRESKDSFYQRELKEKGRESAEKLLANVVQFRGLRELSGVIEPIAVGMRDIISSAKETDVYFSLINKKNRPISFPIRFDSDDIVSAIVVSNLPQHRGCGCTQPDEAGVFGQHGTLPLKALLLVESSQGYHKLCLIFPMRDDSVGIVERGFVLISIERDGCTNGENLVLHVTTDCFLQYTLGITSLSGALPVSSAFGGSLDDRLGFPGAEQYLLKHISRLGPYLSALAKHQTH